MKHANVISTARLTLRHLIRADAGFLRQILREDAVRHYLGGPLTPEACEHVIASYFEQAKTAPHWVVFTGETPCGLISLTPHKDGVDTELSYQFAPRHWGQGYATEACTVVIAYGLNQLGLPRIIAETQIANTASLQLLARLGLHETARITRFGAVQAIYTTDLTSL